MKVEVAVLIPPPPLPHPVPNNPYGLCERKAKLNLNRDDSELRSCVKVEVDVLGFPSLIVRMVSVDIMQR